jgi:hypothetical protein
MSAWQTGKWFSHSGSRRSSANWNLVPRQTSGSYSLPGFNVGVGGRGDALG